MGIRITKVADGLYTAKLSLPDVQGVSEAWSTEEPLTVDRLIAELLKRGAHHTDVGDAFQAVDPDWMTK